MSVVKTLWYGQQYLDKLKKHNANNLKRACIYLANDVKKSLGQKSGPCNDRKDRKSKSKDGKKTRRSESEYKRSKPGDAPGLQCGELRRSIAWEVDSENLTGRVGTNKIYGRFLEKGTKFMHPRPFLKPALFRCQNMIAKILRTKMD